jgi:dihydroxy-acid dehydratase
LISQSRGLGDVYKRQVGYIGPEAAALGPIAYVQNGDMIQIDAQAATLDVLVDRVTWEARVKSHRPPAKEHLHGILEKYARLVSPAHLGAVTHSGGWK